MSLTYEPDMYTDYQHHVYKYIGNMGGNVWLGSINFIPNKNKVVFYSGSDSEDWSISELKNLIKHMKKLKKENK